MVGVSTIFSRILLKKGGYLGIPTIKPFLAVLRFAFFERVWFVSSRARRSIKPNLEILKCEELSSRRGGRSEV